MKNMIRAIGVVCVLFSFCAMAESKRIVASDDLDLDKVINFLKGSNYITTLIHATEKNYAIQCPVDKNWIYILAPGKDLPAGVGFLAKLNCRMGSNVSHIMELQGTLSKDSSLLYLTRFALNPSGL